MDDPGWSEILTVIVSLLITALLARIGTISNALSRATLERLSEEGVLRARLYLSLYQPREVTGQLVIYGQTVAIVLGTLAFTRLVEPIFKVPFASWPLLGHILAAALFVLLSLLICNVIPPYRREENSDRPLPRLPVVSYPIHILLLLPTLLLQRAHSLFVSEDDSKALKEEEFRNIVESETEGGTIEVEEREMIEGIFEFGETAVKEVMIPRIDIACAEISTSPEELLDLIQQVGHSRIPIYEGRIDHIKGVVYVKDLLPLLSTGKQWTIFEVMRPPYFVPETKKLDELLAEFKTEKVHMAIIVEEYGGTSGLVTMEDILEEIVGEIQDEYDEEEPLFRWDKESRVLIADARMAIEDLNFILNVELPQDGYETLGGFIYNHLGHVPDPHETFVFENLTISIEDVIGQRITSVRIEKRDIGQDSEPPNAEIA